MRPDEDVARWRLHESRWADAPSSMRHARQGQGTGTISVGVWIRSSTQSSRRRRLAAIVEGSDDAIISKDVNGIITSWNAAAERMFGYRASDAIGQSIRIIIPARRQSEEDVVLSRIRLGQRVEHFETGALPARRRAHRCVDYGLADPRRQTDASSARRRSHVTYRSASVRSVRWPRLVRNRRICGGGSPPSSTPPGALLLSPRCRRCRGGHPGGRARRYCRPTQSPCGASTATRGASSPRQGLSGDFGDHDIGVRG